MGDLVIAAADDRPVLLHGDGELTAARLLANTARVAAALPDAIAGSHIAFAFERDRAAFLAALLATWARGHAAALPADARRSSIAPVLARPEVRLLVHDTGAGAGLDAARLLAAPPAHNAWTGPPLSLVGPLTSHLDGVARRWSQGELATLLLSTMLRLDLPAGATVWNAFRPAVPCALLPGLLAPLHSGCRIAGAPGLEPRAVAARLAELRVHTLVGPASLLRALTRLPANERGNLAQVVAADEPLDERTIASFAAAGIDAPVLHGLTVATAPDPRRIALQQAVRAAPGVADAAAEIVDLPDGPHGFCAVAASAALEADLAHRLPPSPPTTLRCLPILPRDPDGRIARDALLRLFGRTADGRLPSNQLGFAELAGSAGSRVFRVGLPQDFFAFAGHFPGYPVLSGAVQLHELVLPCLRTALGQPVRITAFQDLKFLARIGPGDVVDVTIVVATSRDAAEFAIARDGTRCSSGRVAFAASGQEPSR